MGNPLAACMTASAAVEDNPTSRHNSAGSRTERANSLCQSDGSGWVSKNSNWDDKLTIVESYHNQP